MRIVTVGGMAGLAVAAALAAGATAAPAKRADTELTGAGSSFVFPLVSQWANDYRAKAGVKITYNPVGSGGGIAAISARQVDFGASDAPLSPQQLADCKGCVQIPWALSSTSIAYHLKGVENNLRITGPVLADIYLGKVKKWNDRKIAALNPGVSLPDANVTPVYRSDNSGTTYNLTDYLSAVSPEWKARIGRGVNAAWPAGIGAKGSSGVAGVVSQTPGAITYVDVAYALKNRIQIFAVRNRAGRFVTPGLKAIAAAASTITTVPAGNGLHIVDPPATNPLAYPICTFTYAILPTRTSKAAALRRFVFYALTGGQVFGPRLLFVGIPKPVLVAAEKTLARVAA